MKTLNAIAAGMLVCATPIESATAQSPNATGEILSAFFGLNDSRRIRMGTLPICRGRPRNDGMPVIFSLELDNTTLDAADFRITTASGSVAGATCVTLRPAIDPGERRTALVVGEYGSAADQPVTVEIVGDVLSIDGSVNFRGSAAQVIPLEDGPSLVFAETVPPEEWSLGTENDCPNEGLQTIIRAVWSGGITKPGGEEIDTEDMALYRITIRQNDGSTATVTPFSIGDLNDNDNNHELCLDVVGEPLSVFFPAVALTDPNEDLNADTQVLVSSHRAD